MRKRTVAWVVSGLVVAGCSRAPSEVSREDRERLRMTTTAPAVASSAIPQPRLRTVLAYLADNGVVRENVAVFEMSHWLMYRKRMEEGDPLRPRYEACTFEYEGTRVALRVGPTTEPWQVPTPAERDMVVRNKQKESQRNDGATILLAGQEWAIGYSMDGWSEAKEKKLTALLWGFVEGYRENPEPAEGVVTGGDEGI